MAWTARDVMQRQVHTVNPDTSLVDLERAFLDRGVSGFPVVEGGRLVGLVSRSDVVRQLCVEQSVAEQVSDFYRGAGEGADASESLEAIGRRVGARIERLRVKDVMVHVPIGVAPGDPLAEVARTLVARRIHRVPVVENESLVGIVTSLDLVRLIAEGRVEPV